VTAPRALSLRAEAARKAMHLATAALPVAWAYDLIPTRGMQWLLGVAVALALVVEFARARGGAVGTLFVRTVGPLLRAHERHEIAGATWLAIGMWGAVMLAPRFAAIAALWAAAVGDAVAALVGRSVQQWRVSRSGATAPPPGKTLIGAAAGAMATAAGVVWLTPAALPVAAALGVVAALAEWPARPGDDNVRVVAAVALAAALVGLR
jgi:dolichol kinase